MTTKLLDRQYYCFRSGRTIRVVRGEISCEDVYDFLYCTRSPNKLLDCLIYPEANNAFVRNLKVAQSQPKLTPEDIQYIPGSKKKRRRLELETRH